MKRWITINSLFACFVVLSLLAGCKDTRPKIYNHSNAFVILENAEDTFYDLRDGGSIQLSYKIKENYPATSAIKQISSQMEANGWESLKEDYLNPGLPSSQVKGWSDFEDASRPPTKIVHQWMGDWQDKHGNIVRYAFIYQYPKNKDKNLSVLQIYEISLLSGYKLLLNKDICLLLDTFSGGDGSSKICEILLVSNRLRRISRNISFRL